MLALSTACLALAATAWAFERPLGMSGSPASSAVSRSGQPETVFVCCSWGKRFRMSLDDHLERRREEDAQRAPAHDDPEATGKRYIETSGDRSPPDSVDEQSAEVAPPEAAEARRVRRRRQPGRGKDAGHKGGRRRS